MRMWRHDCILGNHIIMANAATLGGHVVIEDHATIGAFSGVHPFCRIGYTAMSGVTASSRKMFLPYSKTVSERNTHVFGVNTIGLERKGFTSEQITSNKAAFRACCCSRSLNTSQAVEEIERKSNRRKSRSCWISSRHRPRGVIK